MPCRYNIPYKQENQAFFYKNQNLLFYAPYVTIKYADECFVCGFLKARYGRLDRRKTSNQWLECVNILNKHSNTVVAF